VGRGANASPASMSAGVAMVACCYLSVQADGTHIYDGVGLGVAEDDSAICPVARRMFLALK